MGDVETLTSVDWLIWERGCKGKPYKLDLEPAVLSRGALLMFWLHEDVFLLPTQHREISNLDS